MRATGESTTMLPALLRTLRRYAAALTAVASLAWPVTALAHTGLKRSSPAAGARLSQSPAAIRLWFHERVQVAISRVRLVTPTGSLVLPVRADSTDRTELVASLTAPLGPGSYTVEWQTGGRDGHAVRGRFAFVVRGDSARMAADTATPPAGGGSTTGAGAARGGAFNVALDSMMRETADHPAERLVARGGEPLTEYRVARWAELVALLAAIGVVAFRAVVARGLDRAGLGVVADDATDGARQLGLAALVLLVVAGAARLYGEASALVDPDAGTALDSMRTVVMRTDWGHGWMVGIVAAVVTFLGLALARRVPAAWTLAAIGAAGLAVTPALTGHAVATRDVTAVAVTSDVLHVVGAGTWLGTLLVVLLAGLPAALRRPGEERGRAAAALLASYHPVALVSVGLVLLSGLASSWVRLRSFSALTMTSYGSLLLYKVFIFLFVGLLGAYNWKKVMPRMTQPEGARRFRRSAAVELLVGGLVLALTAVLVATEPPDMSERSDTERANATPPLITR
jgi:copper transport protein